MKTIVIYTIWIFASIFVYAWLCQSSLYYARCRSTKSPYWAVLWCYTVKRHMIHVIHYLYFFHLEIESHVMLIEIPILVSVSSIEWYVYCASGINNSPSVLYFVPIYVYIYKYIYILTFYFQCCVPRRLHHLSPHRPVRLLNFSQKTLKCSWNPYSYKTNAYFTINTMGADALAPSVVMSTANMTLTMLNRNHTVKHY